MKTNRRLFVTIAFGLIAALYITQAAQAQEERSLKRAIEGSWKAKVTVAPGAPPVDALVTYTPSGGLIESDNLFPPAAVTSGHGSWQYAGRVFNNTFVKLMFNAQGQFTGTIKVRETITLSFNRSEYTGTGTAEFFDPADNLLNTVAFTTQATRIRVEP